LAAGSVLHAICTSATMNFPDDIRMSVHIGHAEFKRIAAACAEAAPGVT
jgi:hypothetical protein